ncbi:anthranilate synthase component I [Pseudobutyrivibrio xylanivorans]|uniref:Anthranilate synthase component 1 n=1 Tax=Pseudobutyrivibrio xylanivorans DSM 14809 TaxID=1123012 RepID=A0A1M6CJ42_PSEXY|nr:anthranilate synthase component I [Pseudobutyrivibrio xylanivorans]SHI60933.1 anthranilate synthase component 1 [Pseudobutyrivibrio xylanivorans DSM 14809]
MFPSLEEVKKLAESGDYKRIPVAIEMLSDSLTAIETVRILRNASHQCYLLESASQSETWGRYSFLGFNPKMEITCQDGTVQIKDNHGADKTLVEERKVAHPGLILRQILNDYKSPTVKGLPTFTGGLVGYFSYDYIKYAEPKLALENHGEDDFKDMDLMLFDDVIAFDNYKQKIFIITGIMLDTDSMDEAYSKAGERLEQLKKLLNEGVKMEFKPLKLNSEITPKFSKEEYGQMVEKARHYIKEGDIFQVVLSNPMTAKAEGSLFDTYRYLRSTNPSPYMFYFNSDDIEIAGASPETLVKVEQKTVSTFPLAGTRPRGKSQSEDEALEAELLKDEKELAEHNMLVDLGRNDIGKISKLGSVNVEKYMGVERYSHVMHIGSTVVGQLADNKDVIDAVDAILPAGTLSGAPKFRACQIIEELEQSKRGIYGGALGYIDFAGNLDVCIAIRLVYKKKDAICIRSGAGIVYDSVPLTEAEECINKAKAVVNAVKYAEGGLA